jgi:hypothetical protein
MKYTLLVAFGGTSLIGAATHPLLAVSLPVVAGVPLWLGLLYARFLWLHRHCRHEPGIPCDTVSLSITTQ